MKHMTKMMGNNILASSILVILLFCESAVGARTKLLSANNGQDATSALAPSANDGICATMVETHGYACEEHTVMCLPLLLLSLSRAIHTKYWLKVAFLGSIGNNTRWLYTQYAENSS